MKKKNVLRKLLALTLAAGLTLTGCGSSDKGTSGDTSEAKQEKTADTDELSTVNTGIMTGISEQYIVVAGQEKGLWEKNGVDLQVTEFATGVEAIGAVQTGQIDIAEIMDYAIVNRIGSTAQDTNLRIYQVNYESAEDREDSTATDKFYVNPEVIKSEDDIKGKKISVSLGTVNEYYVAKVLEREGLTPDDVTYVPVDGIQANVGVATNGEIDATWAGGPTAEKLIALGWTPLLTDEELGLKTRDMGVASDTFAKDPALEKYIKARADVIDFIQDNRDEAVSLIAKKTMIDESIINSTLDGVSFDIAITDETLDSLNNIKDWAFNNGNFPENYEIKDYMDTTALEKVFPDRVKYK